MAIPNYDLLSVKLSREIGDGVAAATTDGVQWSSAHRDQFLNEAIRRILRKAALVRNGNIYREYVNTEAKSLVASVYALSSWTGGVDTVLDVYNVTDGVIVNPADASLKEELDTGINQFLLASITQQRYTLNAGNFRLHGGTATSSIRLTYIKLHTDLVANTGSTDIAIPSQYWHLVLEQAAAVALEADPDSTNLTRAALKQQMIDKEIVL